MKKLLIGISALILAACSNDTDSIGENDEKIDHSSVEQLTNVDDGNDEESITSEESAELVQALPGSFEWLNDLLDWESYKVVLSSLKQTASEELIDEELYITTSYIKEPTEMYLEFKSIGFRNTYFEVYANENEGFINDSMSGWEQLDDYKDRLKDTMPARVKLLETLTLVSTYIDKEAIENDRTKELYEINFDQLTNIYKNLEAYIVYGKTFEELQQVQQNIVNDSVLSNLKSGRFHMIYNNNLEIVGFEVIMAFNESNPANKEIVDVFAFSEEYSNVNNIKIERPEGL